MNASSCVIWLPPVRVDSTKVPVLVAGQTNFGRVQREADEHSFEVLTKLPERHPTTFHRIQNFY